MWSGDMQSCLDLLSRGSSDQRVTSPHMCLSGRYHEVHLPVKALKKKKTQFCRQVPHVTPLDISHVAWEFILLFAVLGYPVPYTMNSSTCQMLQKGKQNKANQMKICEGNNWLKVSYSKQTHATHGHYLPAQSVYDKKAAQKKEIAELFTPAGKSHFLFFKSIYFTHPSPYIGPPLPPSFRA